MMEEFLFVFWMIFLCYLGFLFWRVYRLIENLSHFLMEQQHRPKRRFKKPPPPPLMPLKKG